MKNEKNKRIQSLNCECVCVWPKMVAAYRVTFSIFGIKNISKMLCIYLKLKCVLSFSRSLCLSGVFSAFIFFLLRNDLVMFSCCLLSLSLSLLLLLLMMIRAPKIRQCQAQPPSNEYERRTTNTQTYKRNTYRHMQIERERVKETHCQLCKQYQ